MSTDDQKEETYYQKNRLRIMQYSRNYYNANRDNILARLREKYKSNDRKAYMRNYMKQYYAANREKIIQTTMNIYHNKKSKNLSYTTNPKPSNNSYVCVKTAKINASLADLLVKKEAFKKKLAEENNSNIL
jgi:hypothetical protein